MMCRQRFAKLTCRKKEKNEYTPAVGSLNYKDRSLLLHAFYAQSEEQKIRSAVNVLMEKLQDDDMYSDKELKAYLKRVIENLKPEQVQELVQFPYPYVKKIKRKIETLLLNEAYKQFKKSDRKYRH